MQPFALGDSVFWVVIAFISGVAGAAWGFGLVATLVCGGSSLILAIFFLYRPLHLFHLKLFCLLIAGIVLGFFYFYFLTTLQATRFTIPIGKEIFIRALVAGESQSSGRYISNNAVAEPPFAGSFTLFMNSNIPLHYGDVIALRGVVHSGKTTGEHPFIFPQVVTVLARDQGFFIFTKLMQLREASLQIFNHLFSQDEAALMNAMTFGGTEGMSLDLHNQMSLSGTSYLASMYGYKMNILIFGSVDLLGAWVARRKRFVLGIVLVVLFVGMTGCEPSAVRAALMGIAALTARELGRLSSMKHLLAYTAFLMILFNPSLVGQPAFLMSFLSLIGIMYMSVPLYRLFHWKEGASGMLGWKQAIVISAASLLPIIPVVMIFFGQFSLLAFISNALIVPSVLPVMVSGCVLVGVDFLSEHLAFLLGWIVQIFIHYAMLIIRVFSVFALPLPSVFAESWAVLLYYFVLGFFIYSMRDKAVAFDKEQSFPSRSQDLYATELHNNDF